MSTPAQLASLSTGADERLSDACADLWRRSAGFDVDGADPTALCTPLVQERLFVDALPPAFGGIGLAEDAGALARALTLVGGCDLSAGRIFEGHINAVKLVFRYGDDRQRRALSEDILAGAVCGVWNAEAPPGLHVLHTGHADGALRLQGAKIYCSGLGLVSRPLITARNAAGEMVMLAPRLACPLAYDLSGWTVQGMRATATGTVDFTGLEVRASDIVGAPEDYYRGPLFRGGAWRFAAVQTGAVLRIVQLMRDELRSRRRDGDAHQRARLGAAAIAAQTAELWVLRAAAMAEDADADSAAVDAYVNLTRLAVERAALEVIGLAERGLGLPALTRPNPVERVARDLSTYLRQPFPDGALEDAASYVAGLEGAPAWSMATGLAP